MKVQPDRTLVLLRHAKSEWPEDVPDHERPLAARGRRDAPETGAWLRAAGYLPDRAVCSTALRTRQTWELVQSGMEADVPTDFERRVYAAPVSELVDVVHHTSDAVRTLLLVGHHPGIPDLALTASSSGGAKSAAARDRIREKFPTAAVAVLTWSGAWDDLAPKTARLAHFVTPRDLRQGNGNGD
jgi:phosphohistidine phosphatase